MGKVIEFKKFCKTINKDNLQLEDSDIDVFPEDESLYIRKEIEFYIDEIDEIINCLYKQLLINDKLIVTYEKNDNYQKTTYLKDFNDKLHDILYFITNSSYNSEVTIKLNFLELQYLTGTLQLELENYGKSFDKADETNSNYLTIIKNVYDRLYPIYCIWKNE